jgi:hypothetical protein
LSRVQSKIVGPERGGGVTGGCANLNNELHYCGSNQITKEEDTKGWDKGTTYRNITHTILVRKAEEENYLGDLGGTWENDFQMDFKETGFRRP